MRHAKSSWKEGHLADHDRPLNKRGLRDAPRIGELLRVQGLEPDVILSSTARRACQTAQAVAEACGYPGEIVYDEWLYDEGFEAYFTALQKIPEPAACVLLIAHNPDLEELVEALSGDYLRMPTAALAQLELPVDHWSQVNAEVEGRLVASWYPKML
jgi:phosphohistidine phosphatase